MMLEVVVFRLGTEDFGIDVANVIEIIKPPKVFVLPEIEDYILGVITFRGDVMPVIDLRKRFGIIPAPKKERAVIVRSGYGKVALIVDEVRGITGFDAGEISKPYVVFKGLKTEYMKGLGKKAGTVVILLQMENVLTSEEKIKVKESAEAAQATVADA